MKTTPAVSFAMRSRSNSSLAAHVLAALAAASLASSAQAAQITWQGNVSGNMSDAANWVSGVAPVGNVDGIRLGTAGTAGTSLIQNSNLQYAGNLTIGIAAIQFDTTAPAYTISGNGSILIGSGSIISNSTFTQTINNNLRRNTSNPITIGANGGGIVLNGSWDTANGTTSAAFVSTNGGFIALNGNYINSSASPAVTGLTITTGGGGSGLVSLSGNNTALNGSLALGSVVLKLNNPAAIAAGATINQSLGSTAAVWLANDVATTAPAISLTTPNTSGSSMRLVLDRATPGAAYDQSISSANLGQQTNLILQKGARVTSGTANVTISGNTTFGVATGGKANILAARDVNAIVGNVSAVAATSAVSSALVLDGSSNGSKVTGTIANTPGSFLHTVSLGKAGSGTWSLSGNNTYTGITAINGGTLNLDFASASTDANILYNAGSPAVVNLGGGSLKLTGKADTVNSQSVASLAFTGGTESKVILVAGSGNSSLALTTTGNFSVNTGSVVDFSLGAGTSVRNTAYTSAAAFISGGYTIGGTEFARFDTSGSIVAPVPANYQAMTGNNTAGSSTYASLTGPLTRNAGIDLTFKGLKIASSGNDDTLDLNGGNFTFTNSGILYTGGGNGNYTIANGSLRTSATASTSLILNVANAARLTIPSSTGLDNTGAFISEVIKAGEGTLVVSGNKTFTGKTRILNGVYSFDSLANATATSGLGASANVNTNIVLSGGVLQYTGPAASTDRTFQIGSNGATLDASGTGPVTWAPASALGYTNNTNTGNSTTFSQNQFITFAGSNTDANTFGSATGILADPSGGGQLSVTKSGNGTWVLSGNNTYTGATNINGGNLTLGFANFPGLAGPVGKFGDIVFGGGTLVFTATNSADYSSRIRNSAAAIKLNTNGQNVTFAQRVDETNTGGLTKLGAGTLTLSGVNAYTGVTTIEAGTLALSGSLASSISLNSGANLQFTLGAATVPVATTTGNLTLAGNSTVTVVGTPTPDTTYTLLSANGVTGTPVLSSPIAGFSLVAESGSLKLKPAAAADITAPAAPSVALLAASDTGSSGTDLITKLTTPTLRVTLAGSGDTAPVAGDVVKLYAGATQVASATLVAGDITAGYVDLTTSALTAGVISFTATVTDAANNVSTASAALVVTLDTSSPVITLNGSASLTSDWGTAYSDSGATASDNVDASVSVVTVNPVVSSTPGVYTVTYNATDAAGNNASQVTRTVTVSIANASTSGADGLSPLMKYAFGATSPSDTVQAPAISSTATELKLTAVVRTNDANLTVTAETNTDLAAPASWTVTGVTESLAADQTNLPAGCVRKVYSVSITGASKKFLRIKAASTF